MLPAMRTGYFDIERAHDRRGFAGSAVLKTFFQYPVEPSGWEINPFTLEGYRDTVAHANCFATLLLHQAKLVIWKGLVQAGPVLCDGAVMFEKSGSVGPYHSVVKLPKSFVLLGGHYCIC